MGFKPHFSHLPCDGFLSLNCFSMLPSAWTSVMFPTPLALVCHSSGHPAAPCQTFIQGITHMCSQTAPVRDHMASVRHGFCCLCREMSAHQATLPLLGTSIIATCALLLWQCVSMIASHFSCFRSTPPRLPSLADITCQAQQRTTWPCGFCHLFPRAAGKEGSKLKPIKWSVITLGNKDPTPSLHMIL